MKCDTGLLRAYADDALAAADRAAVVQHLAGCTSCRSKLVILQQRAARLAMRLDLLAPPLHDAAAANASGAATALARFHRAVPAARWGRAGLLRRYLTMLKSNTLLARWRPLVAGLAAIACLAVLFSFAPARQAAADFLGIFRVRKFAVIPLDRAQLEKIEGLANLADEGRFGQPIVVREPGPSQPVADVAAASALAGFGVRVPADLPANALLTSFAVQPGPAMSYVLDRTAMQALLAAMNAHDVALPAGDELVIQVDVPTGVTQEYAVGSGYLSIIQVPSPQVALPTGLDPVAIGAAAFRFLGMPDADALRLAQSIDWTSTLVIPMPLSEAIQYREITVDGVPGLLIEYRSERSGRRSAAMLWQRDDILYGVQGKDVDPLVVMQVADSLR